MAPTAQAAVPYQTVINTVFMNMPQLLTIGLYHHHAAADSYWYILSRQNCLAGPAGCSPPDRAHAVMCDTSALALAASSTSACVRTPLGTTAYALTDTHAGPRSARCSSYTNAMDMAFLVLGHNEPYCPTDRVVMPSLDIAPWTASIAVVVTTYIQE